MAAFCTHVQRSGDQTPLEPWFFYFHILVRGSWVQTPLEFIWFFPTWNLIIFTIYEFLPLLLTDSKQKKSWVILLVFLWILTSVTWLCPTVMPSSFFSVMLPIPAQFEWNPHTILSRNPKGLASNSCQLKLQQLGKPSWTNFTRLWVCLSDLVSQLSPEFIFLLMTSTLTHSELLYT